MLELLRILRNPIPSFPSKQRPRELKLSVQGYASRKLEIITKIVGPDHRHDLI